jgi:flagella basal body P-ring formation protein FlgA
MKRCARTTATRPLVTLAIALLAGALPYTRAEAAAADLLEQGRQLLEDRAASSAEAVGGRVEVRIAEIAAERVSHAPCTDPEVFLPPGGLPVGKTNFGLRCPDKPWQIRVPADVALYAQVPVPTRPLSAGTLLQPNDIALAEVNLAAWPRGMVTDTQQLDGNLLIRPLRAGEPIPPSSVQSRDRLNAGDQVQVVLNGDGFVIKADGKAIGQAIPGQSIRVQLAGGRTVTGTLREGRQIEVNL